MSDELKSLYPFLHQQPRSDDTLRDALLESVDAKVSASVETKAGFFETHAAALVELASALAEVFRLGGRLFTMGNGGSACDAAHCAVEFQHPVTAGRPALPAVNLNADTVLTSALSNDIGVEHMFGRQLANHATRRDALIGFSTSGNSGNLLKAFEYANNAGLLTIGFSGGNGGQMHNSGLLDHHLIVASDSIHRVQEVHVTCYHVLWDLVHTLLADHRGYAGANPIG